MECESLGLCTERVAVSHSTGRLLRYQSPLLFIYLTFHSHWCRNWIIIAVILPLDAIAAVGNDDD